MELGRVCRKAAVAAVAMEKFTNNTKTYLCGRILEMFSESITVSVYLSFIENFFAPTHAGFSSSSIRRLRRAALPTERKVEGALNALERAVKHKTISKTKGLNISVSVELWLQSPWSTDLASSHKCDRCATATYLPTTYIPTSLPTYLLLVHLPKYT